MGRRTAVAATAAAPTTALADAVLADAVLAEERALLRGLTSWALGSIAAGLAVRAVAARRDAARATDDQGGVAGPAGPDGPADDARPGLADDAEVGPARAGLAAGADLQGGFARQAIGWGAVDLAIAAWGRARSRTVARDGLDAAAALARARRMSRITGVNALADVGYVASGLALASRPGRRGDGVGVVVQGLALLVLDVRHATAFRRLSRGVRPESVGART